MPKTETKQKVVYVERTERNYWSIAKYSLYFIVIAIVIYLLITQYDKNYRVWLNQAENYTTHYLFSLINAGLLGGFITTLYNSDGYSSVKLKIVLLIVVISIASFGFSRIGVGIWLNLPFLRYQTITTNGPESIEFMFGNLDFLTAMFGISFLIESNK